MFHFVVKYLGWFKRFPLFPLVFDSLMWIWYMLFHREVIQAIEAVEETLLKQKDISIGLHRYGGREFRFNGKEVGHIHSNGLLDVLLSKTVKAKLVHQGWVVDHHVFSNSGWAGFSIRKLKDVEHAVCLLNMAIALRAVNNDIV
ncbi:DUF5519 family protein [Cytophagaceae bacterium ABcell3]|nr:DUF5519 family protein [Cytophagaceae bacterium ABcell3]